jgi:hypothetical protein
VPSAKSVIGTTATFSIKSLQRAFTETCCSDGREKVSKLCRKSSSAHESNTYTSFGAAWVNMGGEKELGPGWARKSTQTSAIRTSSVWDSVGCLNIHVMAFWSVVLLPPSVTYEKSVHGAPQNPMRGISSPSCS